MRRGSAAQSREVGDGGVRVVLQRVRKASLSAEGEVKARIGEGLVLFAGFEAGEGTGAIPWMARKLAQLRVFEDDSGRMNRSLEEIGGEALLVSQFTLYGDGARGRRPSFIRAARKEDALPLFQAFAAECERRLPGRVRTGVFGARMRIRMEHDGPVTLLLERGNAAA